ncbi:MAG: DUF3488 and transglutaminase-like domain-containing protein [Isosphaeraceae bacterium]|nr:DUF3488 and transglutaminase-like domain-containing protein [Isosphaeraceae bacterium]
MNFAAVYRLSFYLMLTLATLSLSIDATDQNPIAMLYPVAVAVAGGLAFVTVDRNPRLGLEKSTADLLSLASLALVYLELRFDENLVILAWTHWLVYLQIIMIFLPKTIRGDWRLFGVSVLQVVVGGFISQSDVEGMALISWAICSLWVLALFTLHREAIRATLPAGVKWTPALDPREPYPKLIDPAFLFSAARIAFTTLALGGVIFLAMPRRPTLGSPAFGDSQGKHLTGFDDEVQLGQLGEILENDSVVMTVVLSDKQTGKTVQPKEELLFRGVSLVRYTRGRWRRLPGRADDVRSLPIKDRPANIIVQNIRLEPTDNTNLFALKPILLAEAGQYRTGAPRPVTIDMLDGSITRQQRGNNLALDYRVESDARLSAPQPGLDYPDRPLRLELSRIDNAALRDRLRAIALPVIEGVPPTDVASIARKLESFLRDSGKFHYTLAMDVVDQNVDPVLDFLDNRKEGHCEYFASALALMLRSLGIPARVVNGFRGGDLNDLSNAWIVRQKHAHSWVEALVNPPPLIPYDKTYKAEWLVLDPTPALERAESISKVGGVPGSFRQITDFARYVWAFYVVGFNAERQRKFIYEPIQELFRQARVGYRLIWDFLKKSFAWVFDFPNVGALFSPRGFLVAFGLLLLGFGFYRIGRWFVGRVWRRFRGAEVDDSMLATGTLFYRRLVDLLRTYGVERPPHETPREFAARAAKKLCEMGPETQAVADVPPRVVDAFYRIRFGRHDLTEGDLDQLETRLDALEARIQPRST